MCHMASRLAVSGSQGTRRRSLARRAARRYIAIPRAARWRLSTSPHLLHNYAGPGRRNARGSPLSERFRQAAKLDRARSGGHGAKAGTRRAEAPSARPARPLRREGRKPRGRPAGPPNGPQGVLKGTSARGAPDKGTRSRRSARSDRGISSHDLGNRPREASDAQPNPAPPRPPRPRRAPGEKGGAPVGPRLGNLKVPSTGQRRPALPRASPAVPSALGGLASGFGMGPGVPRPPWPLTGGRRSAHQEVVMCARGTGPRALGAAQRGDGPSGSTSDPTGSTRADTHRRPRGDDAGKSSGD